MLIKHKITLYFSSVTIPVIGLALFFIYSLFAEYREEEFQQQQKEKIATTIRFLTEIKKIDEELIQAMDRLTIHDFYDEKLLIYNSNKKLIYASLDDTEIPDARNIVEKLSPEVEWIEMKDELYDVVGVYVKGKNNNEYYGVSKAYDAFGYSKMEFLKLILIFTFFGISFLIILISFYLSKNISQSISHITQQIKIYDFDKKYKPIDANEEKGEIEILAHQFNELLKRMYDAFSFQKHAIHHISHELKTPIAVLVSNFEKIEKENNQEKIKELIKFQKEDTKNLSEIINALLEISKAEAGNQLNLESIRIDELIFDLTEELNILEPDFVFSINFSNENIDEKSLIIKANERLLKSAIQNLMLNCIQYSGENNYANIEIKSNSKMLIIEFKNKGQIIGEKERQYLFQHFFRGKNSKGKRGFGLGLVFIHKIIQLHGGKVNYHSENSDTNIFTIQLHQEKILKSN